MCLREENALGSRPPKERAEQALSSGASFLLALPIPSLRRAEWKSESLWAHCTELEGPSLLYCLGLACLIPPSASWTKWGPE